MSEFKGEIKPVTEIAPGSPVQIKGVAEEQVRASLTGEKKAPEYGVLVHVGVPMYSYGNGGTNVRLLTEDGKVVRLNSYKPADLKFKVLTGLKGKAVLKSARGSADIAQLPTLTDLYGRSVSGADPEIFVVDKDNQVIPATTFLPSKKKPLVDYDVNIYWDGFQAEMCHNHTVYAGGYGCHAYLVDSFHRFLKTLKNTAPKGSKLTLQSVFEIPPEMLEKATPETVELGCKPSKNVYGLEATHIGDPRQWPYRCAGGHMHFAPGVSKSAAVHEWQITEAVKTLDCTLGLMGVSLAASFDNPIRRKFYGMAGEHRTPAYGLEYRTLSNFWLGHPAIAHLMFDVGREVVSWGTHGLRVAMGFDQKAVVDAINETDVKAARKLIEKHSAVFEAIFRKVHYSVPTEVTMRVVLGGMETLVKDPNDFDHNWRLAGHWQIHSDGTNENWSTSACQFASNNKPI